MKLKNMKGTQKRPVLLLIAALSAFCASSKSEGNMNKASDYFTDPQVLKLIAAIDHENVPKIEELAHAKVSLDAVGQHGVTPLIYAGAHRKKKAMAVLLRFGANPNRYAEDHVSLMMLCAGSDDPEMLRLVLNGGGNPNLMNDRNQPVIFTAAAQHRLENIKLLVSKGADINGRDSGGRTIALYRAQVDDFESVYAFLEMGSDPNSKNLQGWSLAHYVQDSRVRDESEPGKWKLKVKAFLEQHGTKFPVTMPDPARQRSTSAKQETAIQDGSITSKEILELVDKLDSLPSFVPAEVERVLKISLKQNNQTRNEHFDVYEAGESRLWSRVELRGKKEMWILILSLSENAIVSMKNVETHFGTEHTFSPPNIHAPADHATSYFEYRLKNDILRAEFLDFKEFRARTIVLDRTETEANSKLDGVRSIHILDKSKIEIVRDRASLIGVSGPGSEVVAIGSEFVLQDADHIRLTYTLISIEGKQVHLRELDESQIPSKNAARHVSKDLTIDASMGD